MVYYCLKHSLNSKDIGTTYPQVQKMSHEYNYKADDSVYELSKKTQEFPENEPNLNYFVVHNKAILTDLLSVSMVYGGFLISKKLKILLENFNLANHKFYPAKVYYKRDYYDYYWIHIISKLSDAVDYKNSVFFIYLNYSQHLEYIDIFSLEDLYLKRNKIKEKYAGKTVTIWAEKISLNKNFVTKLDLFDIGVFDSDYYVSEILKNAIEKNKITGTLLEPTNKIHVGKIK